MNILYLCDEYPPGSHGGIGTAVKVLGVEMARKGHTVIVAGLYDWGYGGEDYFEDNGVSVYRFRMKLASKIFAQKRSLLTRIAYRILKDTRVFEWDVKNSLEKYGTFLEALIKKYNIDIV